MTKQSSTFSWSAVSVSALVALAALTLFTLSYEHTNPDGGPDDAVARSFPFVFILGIVCMIPGQLCFYVIGRLQLARPLPSIWLALGTSFALATPLPILFFFAMREAGTGDTLLDLATGAACLHLFIWFCLSVGAVTQYYRIRQDGFVEKKRASDQV